MFRPLEQRGGRIIHTDLQCGPGIELTGDLHDASFADTLAGLECRSAMCANLLEHVADRERVVAAIGSVLPSGALLFVSVPHRFPYHPDPIDTMFRPTTEDLAELLLPHFSPIMLKVVQCGTYLELLARRLHWRPIGTMKELTRAAAVAIRSVFQPQQAAATAPMTQPPSSSAFSRLLPWVFSSFSVTCGLFQKT